MNSNRIKQIFQEAAKTITESGEVEVLPGKRLFDKEYLLRGDVLLWGAAAHAYQKACEDITAIVSAEETWSRASVDDALADFLARVVRAKPESRAEALQTAGSGIMNRFNEMPARWMVDLFVNGMDVGCADLAFGKFSFLVAPIGAPQYVQRNFSLDQRTSLVMARAEVVAIDRESAVERARDSLEEHLGALNFLCSDQVPSVIRLSHSSHVAQTYSIHRAGIPGEEPGEMRFQPVQNRFPLMRQAFLEAMEKRGGKRVSRMLSDPPSEFSDRILSGYVLAGGGCVDPWPERRFLLLTIALESVALGKGSKSGITHQLGARIAHLIGANFEGRRDVAEQMNRLYDRRSHIVHEGQTGVPSDEMYLLYLYCQVALYMLVLSPTFSQMKTHADLDRWFGDRVLDAESPPTMPSHD
jgi:Apea-like HEPN